MLHRTRTLAQTLMDVVLGRKTVGLIRGDIFVNGHQKEQATWSRVCGCERSALALDVAWICPRLQPVRPAWHGDGSRHRQPKPHLGHGRARYGGMTRTLQLHLSRLQARAPCSRCSPHADVEQNDVHSAGTTVREALVFSARLRLTEDITLAQVPAAPSTASDLWRQLHGTDAVAPLLAGVTNNFPTEPPCFSG